MSGVIRKLAFAYADNKGADKLHGNSATEADKHLCFHLIDSTIPLLH